MTKARKPKAPPPLDTDSYAFVQLDLELQDFVTTLVYTKSYAEAARAAGSTATSDEAAEETGRAIAARPEVAAVLAEVGDGMPRVPPKPARQEVPRPAKSTTEQAAGRKRAKSRGPEGPEGREHGAHRATPVPTRENPPAERIAPKSLPPATSEGAKSYQAGSRDSPTTYEAALAALTDERHAQLVRLLVAGRSLAEASEEMGIARKTACAWRARPDVSAAMDLGGWTPAKSGPRSARVGPDGLQAFVDALLAGETFWRAAQLAGAKHAARKALAKVGRRWANRPDVAAALKAGGFQPRGPGGHPQSGEPKKRPPASPPKPEPPTVPDVPTTLSDARAPVQPAEAESREPKANGRHAFRDWLAGPKSLEEPLVPPRAATVRLTIETTPEVLAALERLRVTGLYGWTVEEAAERLVCRGLEERLRFHVKLDSRVEQR